MFRQILTGAAFLMTAAATIAAYAQPAPQTNNAAAVGSTQSTIEAVKPAANPWKGTVYQGVYVDAAPANRGEYKDTAGDSYIGLGYKLSDRQTFEVRQNFLLNYMDPNQNTEYDLDDTAFKLADTGLFKIAGMDTYNEVRLYIPVNEWSREVGKWEARYTLAVEQPITSKFTMEYAINSRFYYFSKDNDGQRFMRQIVAFAPSYKFNSVITSVSELGYDGRWLHSGKGLRMSGARSYAAVNEDKFYLDLGANFDVTKHLGIRTYIEQVRDTSKTTAFQFMDEQESSYNVEITAKL